MTTFVHCLVLEFRVSCFSPNPDSFWTFALDSWIKPQKSREVTRHAGRRISTKYIKPRICQPSPGCDSSDLHWMGDDTTKSWPQDFSRKSTWILWFSVSTFSPIVYGKMGALQNEDVSFTSLGYFLLPWLWKNRYYFTQRGSDMWHTLTIILL